MKRVLVTGGAGFIGSHLVEMLTARGISVVVLDDLSSGKLENLARVRHEVDIIKGDVADPFALRAACRDVDHVFHLAARVSVPESFERPELYRRVCDEGTFYLLRAARRAGVRRLVYAASSSAYGDSAQVPISESARTAPLSPYAAAKLAGEQHCIEAAHGGGVETVRLRFFNVYGPRQDPFSPYAGVVAAFLRAIREGRPLHIHGDGEQTRDFVFVEDVARALHRSAIAPRANGEVVNVGTGRGISIRGLAELVSSIGGGRGLTFGPSRSGDVRHSVAEVSRAMKAIGFRARVPLEQGLRALISEQDRLAA
jgi:UDP-glucose 4-epimerase